MCQTESRLNLHHLGKLVPIPVSEAKFNETLRITEFETAVFSVRRIEIRQT